MSLRFKFILYIIVLHLLFAGVSAYLLSKHFKLLIAVEAVFLLSILVGIILIQKLIGSIKLIQTGSDYIRENDFTVRFRKTGQHELDQLINIYNRMADNLREERTRLQEQNYFLEKVLTASPSGITTLDFDQRIVMANPAAQRILSLSFNAMQGKKLSELQGMFAKTLDNINIDEPNILSLNSRRRIRCRRGQFYDRGFARDFILLDELTDELRQTEKATYERAIRLMSHEVNNTVGSANSLLHSCLHYSDQINGNDRPDFDTAINVIISRTDQLNLFMRSFADIFRLPPPYKSYIDIAELVESITHLFQAELRKRRITLILNIESKPIQINLDRGQMEQALTNIIKNAIEAIETDGTLTIRLNKDFITIEDTGCGLSNNVKENLFTPFFSTKENGQGIGLTLVQEILDTHRFTFSLENNISGMTEFKIVF